MHTFLLLCQLTLPPLPEPLSLEPTLAAVCQCQQGEPCICGEHCDCKPAETKPVISVVRKPRIDDLSPITLAPDPDYPETYSALADFQARHADGVAKVYRGAKLPPEQQTAAVSSGTRSPAKVSQQPPANAAAAIGTTNVRATPQPIDRAVMVWSCQNGTCQWVPASQAPTKSVQSYQRRGLFGRRR